MPHHLVDAIGHQLVALPLLVLHKVREIGLSRVE